MQENKGSIKTLITILYNNQQAPKLLIGTYLIYPTVCNITMQSLVLPLYTYLP